MASAFRYDGEERMMHVRHGGGGPTREVHAGEAIAYRLGHDLVILGCVDDRIDAAARRGMKLGAGVAHSAESELTVAWADVGQDTLNTWPMVGRVSGHRAETVLDCNWNTSWENYSECLHFPGIHPELCDLVSDYGIGVAGAFETLGWAPGQPEAVPRLGRAASWTMDRTMCGPAFPALTDRERQARYGLAAIWPSAHLVAL